MFPNSIRIGNFNHATLDIYVFGQRMFIECLLRARHCARKWGHGSEQIQLNHCPKGVGTDVVIISLPQIEDSDTVSKNR